MAEIKLYGWLLCPFAQRVRFALENLGIKYEYQEIDLFKDRENEQWYIEINPLGQVPSMKFNNEYIYDSLLLLEFLENQYGGIFPIDNISKAQQRIWVAYFNENVVAKVWDIFPLLKTKDEEKLKKIALEISEGIRFFTEHSQLSKRVRENPNTFFEGDKLTYLDYAIIPHTKSLYNFYKLIFKLEFFDLIENDELIKDFRIYYDNVLATDAFNKVTYEQTFLPKKGDNFLLDQLQYDVATFDYNTLFEVYVTKKFIE